MSPCTNKLLLGLWLPIIALLLLLTTACPSKVVQKTPHPSPSKVVNPEVPKPKNTNDPAKNANAPTTGQTVVKPPATHPNIVVQPDRKEIKPIERPPQPEAPKTQYVGLMLPFSVPNSTGISPDSLSEKTKTALEFYSGFLLAFEQLQLQGAPIQLRVMDTENNAKRVAKLLADTLSLGKLDLLVGPIHNTELKEAAAFAKRQKVPLVAPLSPSTQNTQDNPHYIVANPTAEAHCAALYQYISKNYTNKRIILIGGSKPAEISLTQFVFQFANATTATGLEQRNRTPIVPFAFTPNVTTAAELEAKLSPNEHNIFMVTTFADEMLILDLVATLSTLHKQYAISVYGMPNWIDLPNLPLDDLAKLDFHYSTAHWDNPDMPEILRFKQDFYARFQCYPSDYAGRGYDAANYFVKNITLPRTDKNTLKWNDQRGIFNNFQLRPSSATQNKMAFDYLENKFVHIIHFRPDYVLEKVE